MNNSQHSSISETRRGKGITFRRIRRISGYLVHDLCYWNRGKLAEVNDRVCHSV